MRLTPIILVAIGIFTLIYPEQMLQKGDDARWVGIALIVLGGILFWNTWRKMRKG